MGLYYAVPLALSLNRRDRGVFRFLSHLEVNGKTGKTAAAFVASGIEANVLKNFGN